MNPCWGERRMRSQVQIVYIHLGPPISWDCTSLKWWWFPNLLGLSWLRQVGLLGQQETLAWHSFLTLLLDTLAALFPFWWKSRGKCSFWKLGMSLLVKVSWKMLVLEAWILTFGDSLMENARFGSLECHFWWKSCGKCSFWKLGFSLLVKVSWKMLVLEASLVVSTKSVLTRVSSKSVEQECPARVSSKSV